MRYWRMMVCWVLLCSTAGAQAQDHPSHEVSLLPLIFHFQAHHGQLDWLPLTPPTTEAMLIAEYWRVKRHIARHYPQAFRNIGAFHTETLWCAGTCMDAPLILHIADVEAGVLHCSTPLPLTDAAHRFLTDLGCVWTMS